MGEYYVDATVKIWLEVEAASEEDANKEAEKEFGFGNYSTFSFEVDCVEKQIQTHTLAAIAKAKGQEEEL